MADQGLSRSSPARSRLLRRFLLPILLLASLLVAGTAGYQWLEGMEPVDALYMTVITISTVGFGEIVPLSDAGRVFTLGLIVGGAGLAAYTLGSVAEFIISGEWRAHLLERRRERMLANLRDHVVLCGHGRMGRHVALKLKAEGLPFVVIDSDAEKVARIQEEGLLTLHGNAADESVLVEAGIERARGLVTAVNSDAENVFIVLTARSMRPDLLIVARANYEESENKLLRAGADRVVLPYGITGRRMVTMLVRPDVGDFLDEISQAGGLELLLEQVPVAEGSPLVGQTLEGAELGNRLGVTVVACKTPDGGLNTRPGAEMRLLADSQIIALGTREQLGELFSLAQGKDKKLKGL